MNRAERQTLKTVVDKPRIPAYVGEIHRDTMHIEIDSDLCVGSGTCVELCPEMFEIVDNSGRAKNREVPARYQPACLEAVRQCHMDAIKIQIQK